MGDTKEDRRANPSGPTLDFADDTILYPIVVHVVSRGCDGQRTSHRSLYRSVPSGDHRVGWTIPFSNGKSGVWFAFGINIVVLVVLVCPKTRRQPARLGCVNHVDFVLDGVLDVLVVNGYYHFALCDYTRSHHLCLTYRLYVKTTSSLYFGSRLVQLSFIFSRRNKGCGSAKVEDSRTSASSWI